MLELKQTEKVARHLEWRCCVVGAGGGQRLLQGGLEVRSLNTRGPPSETRKKNLEKISQGWPTIRS